MLEDVKIINGLKEKLRKSEQEKKESEQFANDNAKLAGECLIRATKAEQIIMDVCEEIELTAFRRKEKYIDNEKQGLGTAENLWRGAESIEILSDIRAIIKSKLKENKLEDVSADVEPVSIDSVIPDSLESKEDR